MRDAQQRHRIAKDRGRVAAFEPGLAEGGYEGAQGRLADLLAARYEKAGGVPNAGASRVSSWVVDKDFSLATVRTWPRSRASSR
jgi:hypothetical protein